MSLILHLFYSAARSVVAYISCVAWWRIVVRAVCWFALATIWSQVRVPRPLRFSYDPGQVVHTHVPLFDHQAVCIDTGANWELSRHSMQHTSPMSVDLQLRLVSSWLRATETEIMQRRPMHDPCGSGRTLASLVFSSIAMMLCINFAVLSILLCIRPIA